MSSLLCSGRKKRHPPTAVVTHAVIRCGHTAMIERGWGELLSNFFLPFRPLGILQMETFWIAPNRPDRIEAWILIGGIIMKICWYRTNFAPAAAAPSLTTYTHTSGRSPIKSKGLEASQLQNRNRIKDADLQHA